MYTVFLVDDDTLILDELVETILWQDNGFEVVGRETNPQKAISVIEEMSPDVCFIDLKMPNMDGNELIHKLKGNGVQSEFVMISAYDNFESVRAFFQQSGFDYILKPVNSDDIQIVLERLLTKLAARKNGNGLNDIDQNGSDLENDSSVAITDNPGFNHLIEFVEAHYNEKITLEMLSDRFGFSRNYICSLFSKHLNTSLSRYITDIRMKRAKQLLSDKTVLLKEIALELGYKEYYHFYKVFKDYYGYSPKDNQNNQDI